MAKRKKNDVEIPAKGIAIAYARYCGADIPKEL